MATHWYVIRSKPRKEEALWRQVKSKDIEVYFPRLRVNPVNPRSRKLVPYFPGYMFVQVDLEEIGLSTLQWMPYSIGLVSFGGEPAAVQEHLIHEIRKRVDKISPVRRRMKPSKGTKRSLTRGCPELNGCVCYWNFSIIRGKSL